MFLETIFLETIFLENMFLEALVSDARMLSWQAFAPRACAKILAHDFQK
jgi:hypothetical protein